MNPAFRASELDAAVEGAYRAFPDRERDRPRFPLDVCLSCCTPEETEKELREWPRKRLTARHLYEYNCTAKSEVQDAREVGYFLPRMLDLLARGEEIHHSLEISLDRVGLCPPGSWTDAQQQALDRFASAYFDAVLRHGPPAEGYRAYLDDPFSVLLMFDYAGLEVGPLLASWLHCQHPCSTVQFVRTTYWDFWEGREYSNAFAGNRPAFRRKVRDWLLAPAHREQFTAKMLSAEFLAVAERERPMGRTPFAMMVEGVFDQLTSA